MPRPRKDSRTLNINLATPVYENLERVCAETGQTKTFAVERALVAYVEDHDRKQALLKELENRKPDALG